MSDNYTCTYDPNQVTMQSLHPNTSIINGTTLTAPWSQSVVSRGSDTIRIDGSATINGTLTVAGINIADSLQRIEEKLAILRPNKELEEKWDNLRGLRNAYMELEKEILEKEKMWSILKK